MKNIQHTYIQYSTNFPHVLQKYKIDQIKTIRESTEALWIRFYWFSLLNPTTLIKPEHSEKAFQCSIQLERVSLHTKLHCTSLVDMPPVTAESRSIGDSPKVFTRSPVVYLFDTLKLASRYLALLLCTACTGHFLHFPFSYLLWR